MDTLELITPTVIFIMDQINDAFLEGSKAVVMHDMPMHVGYEISESVEMKNLELILDQAENRRHAEKAVMYTLIKNA